MVVVVVVAILAMIAVPGYERYMTRSKLLGLQSALMASSIGLAQYGQDHNTYVGGCPVPPPAEDFTFSCPTLSLSTYEVVATGTGALAGFEFGIDEHGNKTTLSAPSGWIASPACWTLDPQGDCLSE